MPLRRFPRALLLVLALTSGAEAALAQSDPVVSAAGKSASSKSAAKKKTAAAKPVSHKPDPYQSPLATIMSSHLWTNVPEAQDFVRESRPAPKDLKYTPLQSQLGPDPVRPKPRDPRQRHGAAGRDGGVALAQRGAGRARQSQGAPWQVERRRRVTLVCFS